MAFNWLLALPNGGLDQKMTNEEFRLMTSMRCLRKIIPYQEACPTCSDKFAMYGLHALNCGHKSYRHERALVFFLSAQ